MRKETRKEGREGGGEENKRRKNSECWSFPGGLIIKNLPCNIENTGSIPGPGRSQEEVL